MGEAVVAAFVAWVSANWVAIAAVVASAALSIYTANKAKGMSSDPTFSREAGLKVNTRSTQAILPVIYGGPMKIGGNDVFIAVPPSDDTYLWIVMTLSEGECEGIYQVNGIDQVFLGDKLYTEYGALVSYWFHSGSSDQTVDVNLQAAFPEWNDPMRYVCYMVLRLTFDRNYFQNIPLITVTLKGRKLYDYRTATTAWSNNTALAMYDFMTNGRYGIGKDASVIDIASWTSAANYIETMGWGYNRYMNVSSGSEEILDDMEKHGKLRRVWFGGQWFLRYMDLNYETPVKTIEDKHIAQDASGKAIIALTEPSSHLSTDGLRINFIDPDKDWVVDHFIIGEEEGVIKDIDLYGAVNRSHAIQIGNYQLERIRLNRSIRGQFRDDCIELDPGDPVYFNCTALAISGQYMRVVEANYLGNGQIELGLEYESMALHDTDYHADTTDVYTCNLPDPKIEPPGVSNASINEETYDYRGRTFTKLLVSFDPPSNYPWFDHVDVYMSYDSVTWTYMFPAKSDFEIPNVEEQVTYYIRLKTVSIWGTKQADNDDVVLSKNVIGYVDVPASLSSLDAIVNANAISLYSESVTDPDIQLYEFRLGSSWTGSIFLGAKVHPSMNIYGVKPGTHTFFANTLSNNGLYGQSPQSATVDLRDPPDGWTNQHIHIITTPSGEHTNTEWIDYSGDYYVKCSHSGGILSGEYLSHIIDLGASDRYLVYALSDIVVTGVGTTWDDAISGTTTWDEIGISTRSWTQIFELNEGPAVSISLLYGDTSPPTNEVARMEILSTIATGRYFQLKFRITDPSPQVNALGNMTLKFCQ